ncbi:MAG: hypothetical protein NWF05_03725 [Candidatus Bathyarchaeota archaeon]|nr:hypothetical protein [Candidatus Bathyarchaeota archaeon]
MSFSSESKSDWVFRIFDRRTVSVRAKNEQVRKLAAVDMSTSLPFGIDVPADVPMTELEAEKSYFASLKVYTARDVAEVFPELVDFFRVLDVDQSMEDFIKAYWLYPKLIRFELVKTEPL